MPDAINLDKRQLNFKGDKNVYENLLKFKSYYIYHHDINEFQNIYSDYIWVSIFIPLFSRWGKLLVKEWVKSFNEKDIKWYCSFHNSPNTRSLPHIYEIDFNLYLKETRLIKWSQKNIEKEYRVLLYDAPKPILKAKFQRIVFSKSKDRLLGGLFDI